MKKLKKIPVFKNEDEERAFWATHSATDYLDFSKAKPAVFPHLKPTTRPISLRMPVALLDRIMMLANKDDVPYQSYIKTMLSEAVEKRLKKAKA